MASIYFDPLKAQSEPLYVEPAAIYSGPYNNTNIPIKLRIATGGAGESGLIAALANAFIVDYFNRTKCSPFSVAWLKSDTSASFNYLAQNAADLSITYHPSAESIAVQQGIANRSEYAWRDHFMLVGPKSNPARLSTIPFDERQEWGERNIYNLFSQLFRATVQTPGVRFMSRYDKSATNIKESSIWTAIGQTPWAYPYSTWYHQAVLFPFDALRAAARLGEYTLVDRGTWFSVEEWVREGMTVYAAGGFGPDDVLLNPAHALVGTYGINRGMAEEFARWLVRGDGGQKVVWQFEVNGVVLYEKAPVEEVAF